MTHTRAFYAAALFAASLVAIATVTDARQGVSESPRSDVVTVPAVVLKWDQSATTLEEAKSFRWVVYVGGERVEVPEVECLPPTGQTPPAMFSCVLPLRPVWAGKQLQVAAYLPAPTLTAPKSPRLVGLPPPN